MIKLHTLAKMTFLYFEAGHCFSTKSSSKWHHNQSYQHKNLYHTFVSKDLGELEVWLGKDIFKLSVLLLRFWQVSLNPKYQRFCFNPAAVPWKKSLEQYLWVNMTPFLKMHKSPKNKSIAYLLVFHVEIIPKSKW